MGRSSREKYILIVDDNPDMQLILKTLVDMTGWKSAVANNGKRLLLTS